MNGDIILFMCFFAFIPVLECEVGYSFGKINQAFTGDFIGAFVEYSLCSGIEIF